MIVEVDVNNNSYEVNVGSNILDKILDLEVLKNSDKIVVIVSSKVYDLHKEKIDSIITGLKKAFIHIMDDSEKNKNYKYAENFLNSFIESGLTRSSSVVAIGGGVVGDFSGFLAAMYMRGIPVVQVPTTVLSMVDSSVGGKVAVNMTKGKNIIGAFHQPSAVFAEIEFLQTLSRDDFCDGLVESLKHGLIGDSETLQIFKDNDLQSIKKSKIIENLVCKSVQFKGSVVEKDETEGGLRAILNFGHTAAHAIESLMEYTGISHGEAVAIGILIALDISYRRKTLSKDELDSVFEIVRKYNLVRVSLNLDVNDIVHHMKYDKKNKNGNINFVLLNGIGNPEYNQNVSHELLEESICGILATLQEAR